MWQLEVNIKQKVMRRILSVAILLVISVSLFAQNDITKFMGIPIDGFKPEMIQKLKGKGFVSSTSDENILEGEFNGTQVNVYVVTNNNKVCRIMLSDVLQMDETDIKIRFNNLCRQFENNAKYTSYGDYIISEDEDISYEMGVNNKRYEAVFYQNLVITDTLSLHNDLNEVILQKYSEKDLQNPTDEIKADIRNIISLHMADLLLKKPVWFMISEFYGKYYITMFYDNEYNRANGEDL